MSTYTLPTLSQAFAGLLNLARKTQPHIDTAPLEGHSFCIAIDELPQDISFTVVEGRVEALSDNVVPDVTISGSLKAIVYMITHENDGLENDDLYVAGKIASARQVQHFLASFSLDWQAFFNQFMPDNMASKTAAAVEQGFQAARGGVETLGLRLKDYLIKEKQVVVQQSELEHFANEVKSLHQRLDDLSQRVLHLENR